MSGATYSLTITARQAAIRTTPLAASATQATPARPDPAGFF